MSQTEGLSYRIGRGDIIRGPSAQRAAHEAPVYHQSRHDHERMASGMRIA